jgi:hypothetical protein
MSPDPDSVLSDVLASQPALLAALDDVRDRARSIVGTALLEPCRQRVAHLLAGSAEVSQPDNAGPAMRACLAFTDHFVRDVASMPDEVADDVVAALGAQGAIDFANALLVEEQRLRLALMWTRLGVAS